MPTAPVRGICLLSPWPGVPVSQGPLPKEACSDWPSDLALSSPQHSCSCLFYSTVVTLLQHLLCMAWIVASQKCPPRAYGCDLIWKRAFVDIIKGLEMRASWLGRALSPLASVHRREGDVKTGTEMEAMSPPARIAGRHWKRWEQQGVESPSRRTSATKALILDARPPNVCSKSSLLV